MSMPRVLFDVSKLRHFNSDHLKTGIFRVVENAFRSLAAAQKIELTLCSGLSLAALATCMEYLGSASGHYSIACYPVMSHVMRTIAKMRGKTVRRIERAIGRYVPPVPHRFWRHADIFHAPYACFDMPEGININKGIKTFLTVHDLSALRYPEYNSTSKTLYTVVRTLESYDRDNGWFFAVSQSTKDDMCNYMEIDPRRIFVTYLAADLEIFYHVSDVHDIARVRRKYGIPHGEYILCVSRLDERKNIALLVRGVIDVILQEKIRELSLVLAGPLSGRGFEAVSRLLSYAGKDPRLKGKIKHISYVHDDDMAALYSGAAMFCYPSIYEGFGLPVLEAMQCGTPVIAARTSSIPEVVGDAAIMVPPNDIDALCQQIVRIYSSHDLRQYFVEKVRQQAKKFSWQKHAGEIIKGYYCAC